MDKSIFEQNFSECLEKNFQGYSKYFDYQYTVFHEFRPLVFQIAKCLILELNYATITLTNHLLERLLKLALISKSVGIGPIPVENWNDVFSVTEAKYGSMSLGKTIEHCKKENLIEGKEKDILFDSIRELMRNGFSHADPGKVLANLSDEMPLFEGKFSEPTSMRQVTLNPKVIPPLQSIHMDTFATANASNYFSFVFCLMQKLEIRLQEMEKLRTT